MQATVRRIFEVAVKGKWFTVPAFEIDGKDIIVRGKWIESRALKRRSG